MKVLVTGSSGLIGSEAVLWFDAQGNQVVGIDSNARRDFFGAGGDTGDTLGFLRAHTRNFVHVNNDVRNRAAVFALWHEVRPDLVIHCAGQPSHELSAQRPLDDFDVNVHGTMNALEATRRHAPEAVFITMSTNKVYGDAPNHLPRVELPTRFDYARAEDVHGVSEHMTIDQSAHTVFGASKVAADIMTQEYGRTFGLRTGVFRAACITGPRHAGVELHGFLSYLVKVATRGERYTIIGYQGKQVRDQLHSFDLMSALWHFACDPRPGEVYNLGGGRENSASVQECIAAVNDLTGSLLQTMYEPQPRLGDHICYISDCRKFQTHYPSWRPTRSLSDILRELVNDGNRLLNKRITAA